MPLDPALQRKYCRRGGLRRALNLTDEQLSEIARKGGLARWGGLTREERIIERARGRNAPPPPRCACGKYTAHSASLNGHRCRLPEENRKAADA